LGHMCRDDWKSIRSRTFSSTALRTIRALGARWIAAHSGCAQLPTACDTCQALPGAIESSLDPNLVDIVCDLLDSNFSVGQLLADPTFSELLTLGHRREPANSDV